MNEKSVICLMLFALIFFFASIIYNAQNSRNHELEMAKLGYVQQILPGSSEKFWIKGENK